MESSKKGRIFSFKEARQQEGLPEIHFDQTVVKLAEDIETGPILVTGPLSDRVQEMAARVEKSETLSLQNQLRMERDFPGTHDPALVSLMAEEYLRRFRGLPDKNTEESVDNFARGIKAEFERVPSFDPHVKQAVTLLRDQLKEYDIQELILVIEEGRKRNPNTDRVLVYAAAVEYLERKSRGI
ncbi:MAG TPA: hypothetical protein VJK53_04540 [Candidatus Paceibacterota bacterium]